jgi:hypothetical protein
VLSQVKSQRVPSQVAWPLSVDGQGVHDMPQFCVKNTDTQVPPHSVATAANGIITTSPVRARSATYSTRGMIRSWSGSQTAKRVSRSLGPETKTPASRNLAIRDKPPPGP